MKTSNFRFCGTNFLHTAPTATLFNGLRWWGRELQLDQTPLHLKDECAKIHKRVITEEFSRDGHHLCFVLRKDQHKDFAVWKESFEKFYDVSLVLVHESVDFSNLNYAGEGNYLNFFIYKVVKNA